MGEAVKMFSGAQFCGCKTVGWQVRTKKVRVKTKILMGEAVKMFCGAQFCGCKSVCWQVKTK